MKTNNHLEYLPPSCEGLPRRRHFSVRKFCFGLVMAFLLLLGAYYGLVWLLVACIFVADRMDAK